MVVAIAGVKVGDASEVVPVANVEGSLGFWRIEGGSACGASVGLWVAIMLGLLGIEDSGGDFDVSIRTREI